LKHIANYDQNHWSPNIIQEITVTNRGMSSKQAANFYGLSMSSFQKAKRDGKIPKPTLPGGRYDRRLLEMEMDRLSGISESEPLSPLDEWRKRHGSS
jgi:hypothetical protein